LRNSVSNNITGVPARNACCLFGHYGLFALILLSFVTSCTAFPDHKILPANTYEAPVSWFNSDTGHYLFNTSIDLMKNHFTGITVVKPMGEGNFRTIMMAETGIKIMDLEFFPDSAPKVHYIMEAMNKKILIRTLTRDISIILMNHIQNGTPLWFDNYIISPSRTAVYIVNKEKYLYTLEPERIKPSFAKLTKGGKSKIDVNYFGNDQSGIDSIKLSHNNIDLSIRLFRIQE